MGISVETELIKKAIKAIDKDKEAHITFNRAWDENDYIDLWVKVWVRTRPEISEKEPDLECSESIKIPKEIFERHAEFHTAYIDFDQIRTLIIENEKLDDDLVAAYKLTEFIWNYLTDRVDGTADEILTGPLNEADEFTLTPFECLDKAVKILNQTKNAQIVLDNVEDEFPRNVKAVLYFTKANYHHDFNFGKAWFDPNDFDLPYVMKRLTPDSLPIKPGEKGYKNAAVVAKLMCWIFYFAKKYEYI